MASQKLSLAKRLTLGLTLAQALTFAAPDAARAQFFFQPFGYSYRYDVPPPPPDDEERPRFATPRAVSRILARRGFELTSGLGRRGDQVVVTGVSRRDGTFRFFIDPYEGEVIHAVRLAPPGADGLPPVGGPPPGAPRDLAPARPARPAGEPLPGAARSPRPVEPVAKAPPPPATPPAPAVPPAAPPEAAKPVEWAKPAEIAKPSEPAKVEPPKAEAPKSDPSKSDPSKSDPSKSDPSKSEPAKPTDVKADDAKPAPAQPGVPGRRAIVAPKAPDNAAAAPR